MKELAILWEQLAIGNRQFAVHFVTGRLPIFNRIAPFP